MTVYKSIIRSRLEYGCTAFDSAKPKILNKLQVIQNMCIRLITGAYRTSPVLSLHAISGIPPLQTRRNQYVLTVANKISSLPLHPLYNRITNPNPILHTYTNKPNSTKSFIFRAQSLLHSHNITPHSNPEIKYRIIPPWSQLPTEFIDNMTNMRREKTSPHEYRKKFTDIANMYQNHTFIYTDGSKMDNNVGCAFVLDEQTFKFHLPSECSIFTAELYAILKAIEYAKQNITHAIVVTDSLSSIQIIQDPHSSNHIVQHIQDALLNTENSHIRIMWAPSHQGIHGNEKADLAAKDSLLDDIVQIEIPADNIKSYLKHLNLLKWQKEWSDIEGNKLRVIKPDTLKWKYPYIMSRKQKTILTRLMIGHCTLTHEFVFKREPPPICPTCNEALTVEHILVNCRNFSNPKPGQNIQSILGKTDNYTFQKLMNYLTTNNTLDNI